MSTDILKIAEQFPQMCITVHAADLLEFGQELIAKATAATKSEQPEQYLTRSEIAQLFGITTQTIYRWTKRGYLSPVLIGGMLRYRRSDCEQILTAKSRV